MSWLKPEKKPVIVYTDGACSLHKEGRGGWAAVVVCGSDVFKYSGSAKNTTNNRMEMQACIEALKILPEGSHVYLHTDSKYVRNGITQWVNMWKNRGWKTKEGGEVANVDLWKELEEQNNRHVVSWIHVHGHGKNAYGKHNEYNDMCDQLAVAAKNCN